MTIRNTFFALTVGLSACLLASSASAAVLDFRVVDVDNSAAAELADFVTNDIIIDFEGQYTGAQAWIQLDPGTVFQHDTGTATPPLDAVVGVFPALAFDTFVSQGTDRGAGPNGEPLPGGGAVDLGAPASALFDTTGINQAWNPAGGNEILDQTDFMLGRFSLSKDANGTAQFLASAGGEISTYEFAVVDGVIGEIETAFDLDGVPEDPIDVLLGQTVEVPDINAGDQDDNIDEWTLELVSGDPANIPTITPSGSATFSWDTTGSPLGSYSWNVFATNLDGVRSNPSLLSVNVAIPEPSTFALTGLALLGLIGCYARRK